MEDRLVQYPNRVRLVQVDGQPGVYDIEAVPGTVTANGTPLNKATLLSDAVATLVNNAATPNEALKYLAERVQPVRLGGTGASTVEGILANLDIDDYVVEQGTSGIWTYRKWNSGIAECWGYWTTTSTFPNTFGGAYESASSLKKNLPSGLFIEVFPLFSGEVSTSNGAWLENPRASTTEVSTYVLNIVKHTEAINVNIYAKVTGRWK